MTRSKAVMLDEFQTACNTQSAPPIDGPEQPVATQT